MIRATDDHALAPEMICLVRMPAVESFRFATTSVTPPLGLAYVAAAIEASGRKVCVIDAVAEAPTATRAYLRGYLIGLAVEDVVARVPAEAKVVGISVIFTHEWPAAVRLISLLRAARPDVTIILGGEHVSAMPEFCLSTAPADIAVMGEGEETIVHLLDALDKGEDITAIPGTAARKGNRIVVNPRRPRRTDIDSIPWPAWHHFDLETYHRHRFVGGMDSDHVTVPILATRGCPYQCTYCASVRMWSPRWIPRDPITVVDEIEHYVRKFGARNFPFQDLTAILKKDWIIAFCQEVERRGLEITWLLPTGTRLEAVDREVAVLLKRSGMVSMAFAPESGSDTTRRLVRKKMGADALYEAIGAAGSAGLNVALFLVVGFPHETPEHLAENYPFVDRLRETPVNDLSVTSYMALPGTELFDNLYDSGKLAIDRGWFRHILDGNALMPSRTYSPFVTPFDILRIKLGLYWRFYGRRRPGAPQKSLAVRIGEIVGGWGKRKHASRLQTAVMNGMRGALTTMLVTFGKRWMPRAEEERMIAGWDAIFADIRRQKQAAGATEPAPADSAELHRRNIVSLVRHEHEAAYEISLTR
ncbi:MAG TPA: radical SAM protein [Candidatus Omnitrophota bacterium]|nr:radical SAM protein [Candidatus Omnitrophota bacterium]